MKNKFWVILQTHRKVELHGPYKTRTQANVRATNFSDNAEVTNTMVLDQEQLVTLLELMTDTLED